MKLLSTVSEAVSRGRTTGDAEGTFAYRCGSCDERFALAKTRMIAARCPSCKSRAVLSADG
jgi:DNA-directed RNA polymerase subunit RPC12/RpoP